MSVEKSWVRNVQEGREKARRIINGKSEYESVCTPPDYNTPLFIAAILFFLRNGWMISIEEVEHGNTMKIFKITHWPIALPTASTVEDSALHSLHLPQPV